MDTGHRIPFVAHGICHPRPRGKGPLRASQPRPQPGSWELAASSGQPVAVMRLANPYSDILIGTGHPSTWRPLSHLDLASPGCRSGNRYCRPFANSHIWGQEARLSRSLLLSRPRLPRAARVRLPWPRVGSIWSHTDIQVHLNSKLGHRTCQIELVLPKNYLSRPPTTHRCGGGCSPLCGA